MTAGKFNIKHYVALQVGCILTGKDLDTAASCAIMFGWAVKLQCWYLPMLSWQFIEFLTYGLKILYWWFRAPDFNLSTLFRT
ncbi:hypothetical protein Plhal304r1_c051g0134551 [Plasmopara halstedii]